MTVLAKQPFQFQSEPTHSPCPIKKDITQYSMPQVSPPSVNYDNPLSLSKAAYAVLQNILFLAEYHKRFQLLDLCLTLSEDLLAKDARKRLNSFLTNVLRPSCSSFVRVTGRTQKGRVHFHIVLAMAEYFGRRSSGKRRLAALRKEFRRKAKTHGFGITSLRAVGDIEGCAIYLARHIDRPRLREDKKLRRVAYSANFRRVCAIRFSWTSPFASRWRLAVAKVAERYGYEPSESSRRWIWIHYREILECAESTKMPERRFDVVPRTLRRQGKIWTVLRLQEDPNLFVLQRPAEESERFAVYDPAGNFGVIYSTISEYIWRRDLQRAINAERLNVP